MGCDEGDPPDAKRRDSAWLISRRGFIGGTGALGAVAVTGVAAQDDLYVTYTDDARRDEVVVVRHSTLLLRLPQRQFGPKARFHIRRQTEDCLSTWTITISSAAFPAAPEHDLEFVLRPVGAGVAAITDCDGLPRLNWTIELSTKGWPTPRGMKFGPLDLQAFSSGHAELEAAGNPGSPTAISKADANALLRQFFGDRIETDGPVTLAYASDLSWRLRTTSGSFYFFNSPIRFPQLRVLRTFAGEEGGGELLMFDDLAIASGAGEKTCGSESPCVGLYGEALGTVEAGDMLVGYVEAAEQHSCACVSGGSDSAGSAGPAEAANEASGRARDGAAKKDSSRTKHKRARGKVEGGSLAPEPGRDRVEVWLAWGFDRKRALVSAALRHWGVPSRTAAGLQVCCDQELQTVGVVEVRSNGVIEGPFKASRIRVLRQERLIKVEGGDPKTFVVTEARVTPTQKAFGVSTSFGPLTVQGQPARARAPGWPDTTPEIFALAFDRDVGKAEPVRELQQFEGALSLTGTGFRLPESALVGGQHLSRLDFDHIDCRFVLSLLRPDVTKIGADAIVPLGPRGAGPVVPSFDLSDAKLTVMRPRDLLALTFRFSAMTLVLDKDRRIVPNRLLASCRAPQPASVTRARDDDRPMLVVDFPPQHVAERSYFRQDEPPPDLPFSRPKDAASEPAFDAALAILRRPKRRGEAGATTAGERLKARRSLRASAKFILKKDAADVDVDPARLAAFFKDFEARTGEDGLPQEQRLYVDPEFLDPDARRIANTLARPAFPSTAPIRYPDVALPEALVEEIMARGDAEAPPLLEREKEKRDPDYALFRLHYAAFMKSQDAPESIGSYLGGEWIARHLECFEIRRGTRPETRPNAPCADPPLFPADLKIAFEKWYAERFSSEAQARAEKLAPITEARLSGPSRLAFRVNCDDHEQSRSGGGFDFTLEALTNWGSMDLAVVRRAERLMQPAKVGPAPPRWSRRALLDDAAILRFQGVRSGDAKAAAEDKKVGDRVGDRAGGLARATRITPKERMADVYASSAAPPDPFDTAIELPFRLFLSPAQDASWTAPQDRVKRDAFGEQYKRSEFDPLWRAALEGAGTEAGVRAVWSPDFRPEALLGTEGPGAPPRGPWAPWSLARNFGSRELANEVKKAIANSRPPESATPPLFRTALDAYDRHELVSLSSLHGLPVLGRRGADAKILGGSQFDPPDGFRLANLTPQKVADVDRDLSAIYRPAVLSVSELALTSLGGCLDLDTYFTPPASARVSHTSDDQKIYDWFTKNKADLAKVGLKRPEPDFDRSSLFDAFSVERWRQRTVLGRDISVEIVYKGFLFPIGHKAALVKLTERRFEAGPGGEPVALLTQRKFLRIGEPRKGFPAYDHPNEGRRWPCRFVEVLTRRSPDLVDEALPGGGKIDDVATGLAFWPRTAPRDGAEVWFEMRFDEEAARTAMPLIFVDNVAANNETSMARLIEYYNEDKKVSTRSFGTTRRVERRGESVRMAPERKPDDTRYETRWWDLRVEGRRANEPSELEEDITPLKVVASETPSPVKAKTVKFDNTNFKRDAFMEGLDQPAFYPIVDVALCRLAQVERVTGQANLWAHVAFDGRYVWKGFEERTEQGNDDPEVFLRLVRGYRDDPQDLKDPGGTGDVRLNFNTNGDRGGGCAQSNMHVVGISRILGPVGAAKPAPAAAPRTEGVRSSAPSIAAATGAATPDSYFSADAKLLGLLDLKEVIKFAAGVTGAPKLKEAVDYGVGSIGKAGAALRSFVDDAVLGPLKTTVEEVQKAWTAVAEKRGYKDISLGQAFPQIGKSLAALVDAVDAARAPGRTDGQFLGDLALIYEAGRRLVADLERIVRDPVASLAEEQQEALQGALDVIKSLPDMRDKLFAPLKALSGELRDFARDLVLDQKTRALLIVVPTTIAPDGSAARQALDKVVAEAFAEAWPMIGDPKAFAVKFLEALRDKSRSAATALANTEVDRLADFLKRAVERDLKLISEKGLSAATSLLGPFAAQALETVKALSDAVQAIETALRDGSEDVVGLVAQKLGLTVRKLTDSVAATALLDGIKTKACDKAKDALISFARAVLPLDALQCDAGICLKAPPPAGGSCPVKPEEADWTGDVNLWEVCAAAIKLIEQAESVEARLTDLIKETVDLFDLNQALRGLLTDLQTRRQSFETTVNDLTGAIARLSQAADAARSQLESFDCKAELQLGDLNWVLTQRGEVVALLPGVRTSVDSLIETLTKIADRASPPPPGAAGGVWSSTAQDSAQALRSALSGAGRLLARVELASARLAGAITLVGAFRKAKDAKHPLDAFKEARAAVEALGKAPGLDAFAKELVAWLDDARTAFAAIAQTIDQFDIDGAATPLPGRLRQLATAATTDNISVIKSNLNGLTAESIALGKLQAQFEAEVAVREARLARGLTQLAAGVGGVTKLIEGKAVALLRDPVEIIAGFYSWLVGARVELKNKLGLEGANAPANPLARAVLELLQARLAGLNPLSVPCAKTNCQSFGTDKIADQLTHDAFLANEAQKAYAAAGADGPAFHDVMGPVGELAGAWETNSSAIQKIIQQFAALNGDFVRRIVLEAFDLRALKRDVEDQIAKLVPTRAVLSYDLDNELGQFPKGGQPIFIPETGTKLTLSATTIVDLRASGEQTVTGSVAGNIGPFGLTLVPSFHVVSIKFRGVDFTAGTGRSPDLRVKYQDFEIGDKAKFLQPLQDFLSPKGSGFYLTTLRGRPGLEAGYGINLGIIGVGALSFSNVTLNAACRLPFDNSEAQFVTSIGRADAPFLISSTIFGGGGYLALISSTKNIVGFEASFDYGGVFAFGFGPLQGIGRITMGIYVRLENGNTAIGGLFFAGGAAKICCFSVSAALSVRMIQEPGGKMTGSATYTFSFSIGIDDIEFEVPVAKVQGSIGAEAALAGSTRYAAIGASVGLGDGQPYPAEKQRAGPPCSELVAQTVSQRTDWTAYSKYFDDDLKP